MKAFLKNEGPSRQIMSMLFIKKQYKRQERDSAGLAGVTLLLLILVTIGQNIGAVKSP